MIQSGRVESAPTIMQRQRSSLSGPASELAGKEELRVSSKVSSSSIDSSSSSHLTTYQIQKNASKHTGT